MNKHSRRYKQTTFSRQSYWHCKGMCINLYNVHLYSVKLLKLMVLTVSIEELHAFLVYVVDFSLEFHTENKHRLFYIIPYINPRHSYLL